MGISQNRGSFREKLGKSRFCRDIFADRLLRGNIEYASISTNNTGDKVETTDKKLT